MYYWSSFFLIFIALGDGTNLGAKFKVVDSTELKTNGLLDADTGITYCDVVLKAADGGTPSKSVLRTVRVTISRVNEAAPTCDPDSYVRSIGSDKAVDSEVSNEGAVRDHCYAECREFSFWQRNTKWIMMVLVTFPLNSQNYRNRFMGYFGWIFKPSSHVFGALHWAH